MLSDSAIRDPQSAINTTCPYCGVGCGVSVSREQATEGVKACASFTISGDKQHPANSGRLCAKGVTLAETLGSVAANLCVDMSQKTCVGLDINANHVRSVNSGFVYGTARPVHIGSSTQVWEIRITDERDQLICISRITMAVLNRVGQVGSGK